MSSIRLATAANVRAFSRALSACDNPWAQTLDREELEDEFGRFRVWSGNLGALQKGHSSLDYRLRDSPLLSSNALKFLQELEDNLNEAFAIVSGARLPYELQPKPEPTDEDEDNDDGFFDEDDDDEDEEGGTRTELGMRFAEIVDITDNLYKLSVRIRTPTIRSRSLKAATYNPKDPETGVDLLSTYAGYDLQHIEELLSHLRQPHLDDAKSNDFEYLTARLSAAITLRRRQFKYWKRHRDKLGMSTVPEDEPDTPAFPPIRPDGLQRNDTLEAQPDVPAIVFSGGAPSHKTGKTLLSGTEATQHHQSLDEIVDTKSVTSYAVTVKDLDGKGVELPPPPRSADGQKDFECPYCYIICPARYGRGRAWKTHLLQDLQPYICTFPDCTASEQLFRSRREWAEHEASHRKAWRCPEHPAAIYKSSVGLQDHLRREHADSFPDSQLAAIVTVAETTTIDVRTTCPICCAPADTPGLGEFHNHLANHLERIATFALPSGLGEDSDGASSEASRGRSNSSSSRNMTDLSLPSDNTAEILGDAIDQSEDNRLSTDSETYVQETKSQSTDPIALEASTGLALLSAEALSQLPDASQTRLTTLLPGYDNENDDVPYQGEGPPPDDLSSDAASYKLKGGDFLKATVLNLSDIPTLRSMYRSRQLLQRDQSFAPNDSYNRIISFCYHDLTRLEVEAIVNSTARKIRPTRGDTLNNAVHRAAGPLLAKEAKLKGRPKAGLAILTGGYDMPSKNVIHVMRPGGEGHYDQLIDCYHSAFRLATANHIKTIAFPCIGTGGVGFPPRVAARIALEETRKYMDANADHGFERLVFCVNTAPDEKAYIDFMPIYFPPTHGDLDVARLSVWSEDRTALAAKVLDTRNQVQKVFAELNIGLSLSVPDFPSDVLGELTAIDTGLAAIRRFLLWSQEVTQSLKDLKLICSVLQLLCGNITELIDLAKDHANLGQQSDKAIWDDYISDMQTRNGLDLSQLLKACHYFLASLETLITREGIEVEQMVAVRQTLERYKVKQRGGRSGEGTQDHLNEVLYTREFQREAITHRRNTVRLHQIPSVAQLYQLADLDEKPTLAAPSSPFNQIVCFAREDITTLEVDVIVSSADTEFSGIGALERSVMMKGGTDLRDAVKQFGVCSIGDVKTTKGFLLPAKHILHLIPPGQLDKKSKEVLRKTIRKALHTAVTLRATSIAFPSIGTGMLNYPRRDSASLQIEEVKRFLETADPNSLLEKIIFVVFSANDEFIYKSLLPVYFPPVDLNINRALPASKPPQATGGSSSDAPRRTLYNSVNEAVRSVRFGKLPVALRPIHANEEHALINFESHAVGCETCRDVEALYLEGRDLCKEGYPLAQLILWYMSMKSDQTIWSRPDFNGHSVELDVPTEVFPTSIALLSTIEKSSRDTHRSRPLVTPNRSYSAITKDQSQEQITPAGAGGPSAGLQGKRARAHVLELTRSDDTWEPVFPYECDLRIHSSEIDVIDPNFSRVVMALRFNHLTNVHRHKTAPIVVLPGATIVHSQIDIKGEIMLRSSSDAECNSLLRIIRRAVEDLQSKNDNEGQQDAATSIVASQPKPHGQAYVPEQKLDEIVDKLDKLPDSAFEDTFHTSRTPLATRILACLSADLKERPGSYIGMGTDRIASTLQMSRSKVLAELAEMKHAGAIHNTMDEDTWVVSDAPKDLPVLAQEQRTRSQARKDASVAHQGSSSPQPMSNLAIWIMSYMPHTHTANAESNAASRKDIEKIMKAQRDKVTVEEVERALAEIRTTTKFYRVSGTPVGPRMEPGYLISGNRNASDRWTCIHQSIVDPRVLREIGIDFEDMTTHVVLRRNLELGELMDWATRSREIRQHQDPGPAGLPSNLERRLSETLSGSSPISLTAKKVLAYLVHPTPAYAEGAHYIMDIAVGVDKDLKEVRQALVQLEKMGKAHATGVGTKWWAATVDVGRDSAGSQDQSRAAPDDKHNQPQPSQAEVIGPSTQDALSPLATQVHAYLAKMHEQSAEAHSVPKIAALVNRPVEEVGRAFTELERTDMAHSAGNTWQTTEQAMTIRPERLLADQELYEEELGGTEERLSPLAKQESEAQPGVPSSSSAAVMPSAGRKRRAASPPTAGAHFNEPTSEQEPRPIDRRLVNPQVLDEAEEAFDDAGDNYEMQRQLRPGEVEGWVEPSETMRRQRDLEETEGWEKRAVEVNRSEMSDVELSD